MSYTVTGTAGNDTLNQAVDVGPGTIVGLAGDDTITAGRGSIYANGGSGRDFISAGRDVTGLDPHRPTIDEVVFDCPDCGREARRVPEVIDTWYLRVRERQGGRVDLLRLSRTGKPEHYVPPSETKLGRSPARGSA